MHTLFKEDVTAIARTKVTIPARGAMRHGSEAGSVTLGGRRLAVQRPRVRTADGKHALPVPAYDAFASRDLLTQMALERMIAGSRRGAMPAAWSRWAALSRNPHRAPRGAR